MSEQVQGFKRINFFKGFLTTEKDWNDAERDHIDKRRLRAVTCRSRFSRAMRSTVSATTC